jgi:hypothetical protein
MNDHDMTPVEVAAAMLAGNAPGMLAEWKAALLAGLALGYEFGALVATAKGQRDPAAFGQALGVAAKVGQTRGTTATPHRRLTVRSWPEGFAPKPPRGDR